MGVDNIAPAEVPRRPPEEDLRTPRAERKGRVRPAGEPGEDRWEGGTAKGERRRESEEPQAETDEEPARETVEVEPQPERPKGRKFDRRA